MRQTIMTPARPPRSVPPHLSGKVLLFLVGRALLSGGCQEAGPSTLRTHLDPGWEFSLENPRSDSNVPGELVDTLLSWMPADVPGTVHTDLLSHGLIPDPFWGDREMILQWIGQEDWSYRTTFSVANQLLEKERVELVFNGLDTYAQVRLNGDTILEADNMFRAWKTDVKSALQAGENTLEVAFRSPLEPALEARAALVDKIREEGRVHFRIYAEIGGEEVDVVRSSGFTK